MQIIKPAIIDQAAHAEFLNKAVAAGLNPSDRWVNNYVSISWERARPFFMHKHLPTPGSQVLEFGCNLGASSIMLAAMGAEITAIDINPEYVDIAHSNAKAHNMAGHIKFLHVPDTRKLPFANASFDLVVCNSVLEYVHPDHLAQVLDEIDRVLNKGGVLFILGTSSRLWPREVHSNAWLVNYLPSFFDPALRILAPDFMRGLNPCQLTQRFSQYENLDRIDACNSLLAAKAQTTPKWKYALLKSANKVCNELGLSLGLLLPSIIVALRKP